MFALISSEELESQGQIMVKQLKNRYNDLSHYKRFVIGVERAKMKLFDVDGATDDLVDDTPVMDKSMIGQRLNDERKMSFEGFK
jgi:hypothetical protein